MLSKSKYGKLKTKLYRLSSSTPSHPKQKMHIHYNLPATQLLVINILLNIKGK